MGAAHCPVLARARRPTTVADAPWWSAARPATRLEHEEFNRVGPQRGTNSWELRIYQGVDPENGKERWATKTVRGSRRFATAQLREFRQVAICGRIRAGTVAELLTQWTEAASPGWAATTKRETKSLIDRHLIPCLGHLAIAKLTTADIDDFYGHLLRRGGKDERPLCRARFSAPTLCCIEHWLRPSAGTGFGSTQRASHHRRVPCRRRFVRLVQKLSRICSRM